MRRLTLIAAIAVLAFAGCGGDDEEPASGGSSGGSSSSSGGGENLAISADAGGALKFDKSELTAPAGKVTITMANPSDVPHNVVIDADGAKAGATVGNGQDSVASADLQAGEYQYYCAVGNHRAEGMEGTLTVE